MTEHSADTVERVAKAINGPQDATHIGKEKLHQLQDHKWAKQTSKHQRAGLLNDARAALSALTVEDAAKVLLEQCDRVRIMGRTNDFNHIGVEFWRNHPSKHPSAEYPQESSREAFLDFARLLADTPKEGE